MRIEPLKLFQAGETKPLQSETDLGSSGKSFANVLSDAITDVNKLQNDAQQASINLATGKLNDVSEVVIATEKATIALQLTMQVRNKIVEAYQEVMRMQV
ncbi:MAG: flagellar hook-basal body complex protein FliE [Negativicutes bacterium]|nr:flagellar hook-basal body complex protein FliE [Negativicutes bacterium]